MAEGSERPEDEGERRPEGDDLEELRKEIRDAEGGEEQDNQVEDGAEEGAKSPETEDTAPERFSEDDVEEFRKQLLDDYGPEGLGMDEATGQGDGGTEGPKEEPEGESGVKAEQEGASWQAAEEETKAEGDADAGQSKEEARDDIGESAPDEAGAAGAPGQEQEPAPEQEQTAKPGEEHTRESNETSPKAPKEEDQIEHSAKAETYVRSDNQVLVVAHGGQEEAGEAPAKKPERVQTSDLQRLQAGNEDSNRLGPSALQSVESQAPDIPPSPESQKHEASPDAAAQETASTRMDFSKAERIQTERREPEHVIRATPYGDGQGHALRVPKGIIPEHDERELLQIVVAKESAPRDERTLYMMHNPEEKRGYLDLFQIDPKDREPIHVREISVCDEPRFAEIYNGAKPAGLENTTLEAINGDMLFRVDSLQVPLDEPKFRTWQAKAILEGCVSGEKLQVVRDSDSTNVRLADRLLVLSMHEASEGLRVQYTDRRLHDETHVRVIGLENNKADGELPRYHRMLFDDEGLELGRRLELSTDSVFLRFSAGNRAEAARYWNLADNPRERLVHRGDIGECVADAALRKSEFRVLDREAFGRTLFHGTHRSERTGADAIFEYRGSYYSGMVKAYANPHTGLKEAKKDVIDFGQDSIERAKAESRIGAKISGGLAIEVFWPHEEAWGAIYTDYVHYGSDNS